MSQEFAKNFAFNFHSSESFLFHEIVVSNDANSDLVPEKTCAFECGSVSNYWFSAGSAGESHIISD